MAIMWFVSFSFISKERTTECKYFKTLKDAKEFLTASGANGYIVRSEDKGGFSLPHKSSIVFITKNFCPSAKETMIMNSLNFN